MKPRERALELLDLAWQDELAAHVLEENAEISALIQRLRNWVEQTLETARG